MSFMEIVQILGTVRVQCFILSTECLFAADLVWTGAVD